MQFQTLTYEVLPPQDFACLHKRAIKADLYGESMAASVVIALNEPELAARVVSDLIAADYEVLSVQDPLAAYEVLKPIPRLRVLVTAVEHGTGKLNGLALACSAKVKRRQLDVVFGWSDSAHRCRVRSGVLTEPSCQSSGRSSHPLESQYASLLGLS